MITHLPTKLIFGTSGTRPDKVSFLFSLYFWRSKMKLKIDTNHLVNVAANAFVSAMFGGIGSYAVHKLTTIADKKTNNTDKTEKRPIGFDLRG